MKKAISIILCLGMIICLSGCEKPRTSTVTSVTEPSVNVTSSSTEEPVNEPASENKETPGVATAYAFSPVFDSILCIDDSGEIVDVVSTSPEEGDFLCIANGYVYIRKFDQDAYNEGRENFVLKVMDLKTGSVEEIYRSYVMNGIDIYNGLIYINSDGTFAEGGNKVVLDEKTHQIVNGATIDVAPVEGGFFELPQMLTYSNRSCEERMLREVGYIIVNKDQTFYTYDGSALLEIPNLPEGYKSARYYDKQYLVYTCTDEYEYKETIHVYDLASKRDIYVRDNYYSYNTFADGKIYFTTTEGSVGTYDGSVWCFDVKTEPEMKVFDFSKEAGMPAYTEGSEGFCVVNGKIFFVGEDDKDIRWYIYDAEGIHETEYVLAESAVAEFGHAECAKCLEKCGFCDEVIFEFYEEYLSLDSTFSPYADAINETMKNNAMASMEDAQGYMGMQATDEADCENFGHGQYYGCETSENRVVKVALFSDDKYLYVEKQGYWYGGGAHGYPLTKTELYDLTTGEQVDFLDVFPGTQEELRKLIADKTVELYEYYESQNEGYNPFEFEEDSDTVYEIAYESVEPPFDIWFTDEGIIYYYPPYVMACYAEGYVEVPISFEDMGLSDIFY